MNAEARAEAAAARALGESIVGRAPVERVPADTGSAARFREMWRGGLVDGLSEAEAVAQDRAEAARERTDETVHLPPAGPAHVERRAERRARHDDPVQQALRDRAHARRWGSHALPPYDSAGRPRW